MIPASEYLLDFFRERGFERKRCAYCKSWFWTLNPDLDHCNDAPCTEYTFFDIETKRSMSPVEVRKDFIRFFAEHGHTPVEPRPVVARWRDDLYLTIASIVDFQPFVTSGVVPPPANPLVISQPCIRLEDIDNVGKTAGRHMTSFEMAAHHAFNYPDLEVYWKEETVEYAFEYFTKSVGVPEDQLVFKESWWEGGGNAGPSFEVAVGGLELATLVFMKYEVADGEYKPMKLRVVDTGYGVERISWLTLKTPTAFHAVYPTLVHRFHDLLGVEEPPDEFLKAMARLASVVDVSSPQGVKRYYEALSARLGMPLEEVKSILSSVESVYVLLDHTKTLVLMLADGIVPSNTGEGYLARLVVRRALRALRRVGSPLRLVDLVSEQLKHLEEAYGDKLRPAQDYILEVVDLEERRYEETLKRGLGIVSRVLARYRDGRIPLEELVVLYDSHGIPPEVVVEVALKRGVSVVVPENFYSIVASRHARPSRKPLKERALPEHVVAEALKAPPTRPLYHEDPYLYEFEAKVVSVVDGRYLILDKTAFYPEGGGQAFDTGIIACKGKTWSVVGVYKVGDVVVHVLEGPADLKPGSKVRGVIDKARRASLMRHHTATHILLASARRVLGRHVWQAGADKKPDKARLDITHHKPLTDEEVKRVELLANELVLKNVPLRIRVMDRVEAEREYGLTLYQGGVPSGSRIRVVEIPGFDAQACYGTHCKSTGEVGAIKIISVDRIQDGVVRLTFVAGLRSLEYVWELEELLSSLGSMLRASREDLIARAARLLSEVSSLRGRVSELERALLDRLTQDVLNSLRRIGGVSFHVRYVRYLDPARVPELAKRVFDKEANCLLILMYSRDAKMLFHVFLGPELVKRLDASLVLERVLKAVHGRGGGRGKHAQGVIEERAPLDEVVRRVEAAVEELLRERFEDAGGQEACR